MTREHEVQTDWMNDPKNLIIALLTVVALLLGVAALGERLPAGFTLPAAQQGEGQPVSVLDVMLDREGLRSVDILLDRPVGEDRVGETLSVDAATIRPAVGGVWRWQGANVLRFEPAGGLEMAMRYEIALVGERILPAGYHLSGQTVFEIVTDRFRVERVDVLQEPAADGEGIQVRGQITFNYDVDPEALVARMRLLDPTAAEPIELRLESYYPQRVIGFHSEPVRKLPEERELRLVVGGELTPATGNVRLLSDFEQQVVIGSSENLSVWEVEAEPGDPDSRIIVRLSSPADPGVVEDHVSVSPTAEYRVTMRRNEMVLIGSFQPGTTYTVELEAGMQARDRAVLRESFTESVYLPDIESRVDFAAQGMFLSAAGNRALEIESVNAGSARLIVERVYPNNLFYLFDSYGWMVWDQESWTGSAISHSLGDRLADVSLELPGTRNRTLGTPLVLDDWIDTDQEGLYRLLLALPGDSRAVQRWVQVTDVGLVAKRGQGDLLVWASSFADLTPVRGARLRLVSDQNQVIAEGRSDSSGLWHPRDLDFERQRPHMILADGDGRMSFLLLDSMRVDTTGLDVDGATSSATGYQAFLYGERDIYRPGETVHGAAIVRDRQLSPVPAMPLRMRHVDPTGLERLAFRIDLEAEGVAPFELDVPEYARTGGHVLQLLAGEDVIGSYDFQVEEFVPDRIRVEIDAAEAAARAGETLDFTVAGTYLFGPPAQGLAVETRVRLESRSFAPEGFSDYSFVTFERSFTPTSLAARQDRLGEDGTLGQDVEIPEGLRVPSSLEAVITARVQEQGGRGVLARRLVPVHPYPHYVGVRRVATDYAEPGVGEEFEFVVVDPEGELTAPRALRAELVRDEWRTVLRRTPAGTFRYESTRDSRLIDAVDLDPAARGSFSFTVPEVGAYRVVLSDPLAGAAAEAGFTASGFGFSPWAVENPARVELELDREEYTPGDAASVQVRAPFPGRLLLTVERDGVREVLIRRLEGNTATLRVPVGADLRPNGYVTATVIRSASDLGEGAVGRAFGAVPLYVDRGSNRMPVELDHPEEMRPDGPLEIEVLTDPGAVLTVAAVDEGILQLIAQQTPGPFEFFYRKLGLGVSSHDTFSLLFPEVELEGEAAAGGGAAADAATEYVRTEGIRRVRPVAFWSGLLQADASGRAHVSFEVPEFQGALRVMTVSARGRRFGAGSSSVRVRDPLVLLPTLPRFMAFGDRVRIPVGVRNDTGSAADVRLRMTARMPDGTVQESEARTSVPDGAQRTEYLELQAPDAAGAAEVEIVATGAGETSRTSITVPVRPALPVVGEEVTGVLQEASTTFPAVDPGRFLPGASRSLRIGATPLLQLSGRLQWLMRYPYGCLEQVTSGAFPLVWLGELARELHPEAFADGPAPAALVQEAIRRIGTYQTFSGAFTLWPGANDVQPWASVYATHFLVEARRAGLFVPAAVHDRALEYLRGEARSRTDYGQLQLERVAYGLYVLARAGQPEAGTMDFLRERYLDRMRPASRSLLAAAYAATGNREAVQDLVVELERGEPVPRQTGANFDSPLRNRALTLLALHDAAPGDSRIPALASRLAREVAAARWLNTQESAFALLALGQIYDAGAGVLAGRVEVDGRTVGRFDGPAAVFEGLGPGEVRIVLDAEPADGGPYYALQTRGVPTAEAFAPATEGLEARRVFLTRDGEPADLSNLVQGDLLAVRIQVRSTAGPLENVVIQSLVPAGLEVENPRLTGSETLPWIGDADLATDHVDVRDDGVYLFTSLPESEWRTTYALVRAVAPGTFTLPPLHAEAMYEPSIRVTGMPETVTVGTR